MNVIYRNGPYVKEPDTKTAIVDGDLSLGTFVEYTHVSATPKFTALDTAGNGPAFILMNRDFYTQTVNDAYVSGDTGAAYHLRPCDTHAARLAAETYSYGDALTIATGGVLAKAATGDRVIAHYAGAPGGVTEGELRDVTIATGFAAT